MKLSFTTLGSPAWPFEAVLDNARRMGFDGIELRGIQEELRSEKLIPLLPENAGATQEALRSHGLSLCCLDTSVSFDREGDPDAAIAEGQAAIAICDRMGIPYLRIFGNSIAPEETVQAAIDRVTGGIRRLCEGLNGTSVRVLLEVHGDYDRVERLLPIIEGVAHPQFGLLWDIMHSDRVYGDRFEDFYRPLAPYIHHVHVKDYRNTPEGRTLCAVGEGDLPVAAIVTLLETSGYDGFYAFEWEKRWHPELPAPEEVFPRYVRWMRDLAAQIAGARKG